MSSLPVRLSVVIPAYGRPDALRKAVQSVLADVRDDVELIVVDDASPEDLPVASLTDPPVRVIRRRKNGGVAAAQNTGLFASTGTYIAFLHSDDEWISGRTEQQLAVLARTAPHVGAVESATVESWHQRERLVPPRCAGKTHQGLMNREVRGLHISGLLFRRTALLAINGFDEVLRSYEDLDVLIRLTAGYDIVTDLGPAVVRIRRDGDDRLGNSPWMNRGRLHLLRKYLSEVDGPGGLPAGWRDWATRGAADLLISPEGDRAEAAQLLQSARRGDRRRAMTSFPLAVAARLPRSAGSQIARWTTESWIRQGGGS